MTSTAFLTMMLTSFFWETKPRKIDVVVKPMSGQNVFKLSVDLYISLNLFRNYGNKSETMKGSNIKKLV